MFHSADGQLRRDFFAEFIKIFPDTNDNMDFHLDLSKYFPWIMPGNQVKRRINWLGYSWRKSLGITGKDQLLSTYATQETTHKYPIYLFRQHRLVEQLTKQQAQLGLNYQEQSLKQQLNQLDSIVLTKITLALYFWAILSDPIFTRGKLAEFKSLASRLSTNLSREPGLQRCLFCVQHSDYSITYTAYLQQYILCAFEPTFSYEDQRQNLAGMVGTYIKPAVVTIRDALNQQFGKFDDAVNQHWPPKREHYLAAVLYTYVDNTYFEQNGVCLQLKRTIDKKARFKLTLAVDLIAMLNSLEQVVVDLVVLQAMQAYVYAIITERLLQNQMESFRPSQFLMCCKLVLVHLQALEAAVHELGTPQGYPKCFKLLSSSSVLPDSTLTDDNLSSCETSLFDVKQEMLEQIPPLLTDPQQLYYPEAIMYLLVYVQCYIDMVVPFERLIAVYRCHDWHGTGTVDESKHDIAEPVLWLPLVPASPTVYRYLYEQLLALKSTIKNYNDSAETVITNYLAANNNFSLNSVVFPYQAFNRMYDLFDEILRVEQIYRQETQLMAGFALDALLVFVQSLASVEQFNLALAQTTCWNNMTSCLLEKVAPILKNMVINIEQYDQYLDDLITMSDKAMALLNHIKQPELVGLTNNLGIKFKSTIANFIKSVTFLLEMLKLWKTKRPNSRVSSISTISSDLNFNNAISAASVALGDCLTEFENHSSMVEEGSEKLRKSQSGRFSFYGTPTHKDKRNSWRNSTGSDKSNRKKWSGTSKNLFG